MSNEFLDVDGLLDGTEETPVAMVIFFIIHLEVDCKFLAACPLIPTVGPSGAFIAFWKPATRAGCTTFDKGRGHKIKYDSQLNKFIKLFIKQWNSRLWRWLSRALQFMG